MTDLSNMTLSHLEAEVKQGKMRRDNLDLQIMNLDAEIERRKAEPDWAAWEPKRKAFNAAINSVPPNMNTAHQRQILGLIAAHNTPLAGDEWIPWAGGECPVPEDTVVDAKLRNGAVRRGSACVWYWLYDGPEESQVTAYRVVKP